MINSLGQFQKYNCSKDVNWRFYGESPHTKSSKSLLNKIAHLHQLFVNVNNFGKEEEEHHIL